MRGLAKDRSDCALCMGKVRDSVILFDFFLAISAKKVINKPECAFAILQDLVVLAGLQSNVSHYLVACTTVGHEAAKIIWLEDLSLAIAESNIERYWMIVQFLKKSLRLLPRRNEILSFERLYCLMQVDLEWEQGILLWILLWDLFTINKRVRQYKWQCALVRWLEKFYFAHQQAGGDYSRTLAKTHIESIALVGCGIVTGYLDIA